MRSQSCGEYPPPPGSASLCDEDGDVFVMKGGGGIPLPPTL